MKTNRFTKLTTVLALFMLFACENQEILQLEEEAQTTESNFNLESFQIKELPDLASEINILTKSSKIGFASKSTVDDIVLDESRILTVTDSVGNNTFSIRMYVPETPYNVFHNLVIKQTPDGKMNEPFILRYEVREDYWPTYISSERKDAPFYGNLDVYSISSINELGSKTNKNGTGVQPCYPYSVHNGSSSSGSNSSNSGGGNSNGYSGDPGTQGGFSPVGIVWSKGGGGYVEVGLGVMYMPENDNGNTKKSYSAKNGECPEDEMLVPINEEDFKNPCKQMNEAESNNALKSKLKELKGKLNDNREFGRLITGTNPTKFSSFKIGKPNDGGISFATSSKIDGYLHSHYNDLLPVFSGSDIKAIYDLYKKGNIRKLKTFTAYVVASGTTYALKIDDTKDFLRFGDQWFKKDDDFLAFERLYSLRINTSNSNSQNELAFANFIKESGLKLFKGNPITFAKWTAITSNRAKTGIINDDCN